MFKEKEEKKDNCTLMKIPQNFPILQGFPYSRNSQLMTLFNRVTFLKMKMCWTDRYYVKFDLHLNNGRPKKQCPA